MRSPRGVCTGLELGIHGRQGHFCYSMVFPNKNKTNNQSICIVCYYHKGFVGSVAFVYIRSDPSRSLPKVDHQHGWDRLKKDGLKSSTRVRKTINNSPNAIGICNANECVASSATDISVDQ